jgi:signal transduction histidine kinase
MGAVGGEEQARLDLLPDGVVIADGEGEILSANQVAAQMLGSTLIGRVLGDALRLVNQDGESWCETNQPFAGPGIRTGIPEQPWLLPSGEEVLVAARIHRPSASTPIQRVAITLRSGRARSRLDRERSDLVATVAHELRSPLTGVKGFVQALLNRWDKLNDEQKKLMLRTVHSDSERLSRLIAELLDIARIDTGRLSLFPRPVEVDTLLGRVVESVQVATTRPVRLVAGDDLPQVLADPDRFTQVFTNLVDNAIRHGAGTVTVEVAAMPADDDLWPGGVRILVRDEGEGIAPEMRRRVFTKFWTSRRSGGSGLGLYLVQGLVRAHGGDVRIEDAEPQGAQIAVDWPAPTY